MAEGLPHPELVIEAGPDRLRGSLLLLALLLREVTTLPLTLTLPLPLTLTLTLCLTLTLTLALILPLTRWPCVWVRGGLALDGFFALPREQFGAPTLAAHRTVVISALPKVLYLLWLYDYGYTCYGCTHYGRRHQCAAQAEEA